MAEIDLTPTEEMAANAARGLELRRKHGKGGTEIGVARARDISNRKNLSPETVRRMHAFFSRHEKNKAGGEDDAGYIAWLLWGGDSGQSWAKRKVEQMDKGENQRSDTYKEIAQRLGGVAKFASIDAGMMDGAGNEVVIRMADGSRATARYNRGTGKWSLEGHADVPAFAKVRDLVAHLTKQGMARPGDKSKMQKEYVLWGIPKGKTSALDEQVLSTQAKTPAQMDAIKKRAAADGWHSFRVQILDLSKPYKGFGFSRPVAKAKFAADAREVGNEILRQLGGGRFMSMVGGKNAMYGTFGGKPGLQVSIGKGAEGGINRVIVTLDPATDTYRMEFWKIAKGGMSTQKVSEASMVYADDLQRVFTDRTRFYTSMSRPGAKAKMGREKTVTVATVMSGTGGSGGLFKVVGYDENGREFEYGLFAMRSMAEQRAKDVARWKDWKYTASRPGAKAKMQNAPWMQHVSNMLRDLTNERQRVQVWIAGPTTIKVAGMWMAYNRYGKGAAIASRMAYYLTQAAGTPGKYSGQDIKDSPRKGTNTTIWTVSNVPEDAVSYLKAWGIGTSPKAFAGFTGESSVAYARPGAKVANAVREGEKVSAADDAVSRKIRKLMDEGKPQKQAVAIALDLERRGEL